MWFLQKLRGKMEEEDPFGPKSQQQLPDSIDNDHLVQILAQDLQNLVLSCNQLEAESSSGTEKVDPDEFRVLEDEDASVDERVQDLENQTKNVKAAAAYHYPLRLDAEDCAYYIRTGMCKFGSNCKFNHPIRRKIQPIKETKKQKEENVVERHAQTECKYHTSSAGCKYGKACKFNHGRGKSVKTPVAEYNFLGLPIRPGEKECPYYMRNGSCKYGPSCRFNHPDPTAVGGDDVPTTYANDAPTSYGNEGPLPLQPAPQPNIPNMPSWSAPRTPDPTAAFVPPMVYPPTQNMPPPNPDWNGYQAPAHLYPSSEQGLPIPPAFFLNNPQNNNTNMYTHHQQQQPMLVSEYPERPGQPDCSYFMKTGDCKYRTSCKFNHPQSRTTTTLRDQNICTYFSRHGTCKYGAACKYDHPVNYNSNSNPAREGYNGSNGPKSLIQQSV
ncbi:putative transcription factor C3H family [Helianthus annuus]|uniref:Putative zinc finger, CCCH-type n=1 Tax=Helianthus annuus TaxID=4232 RepID=A0A251RVH4_HELAN|nr:zinc finger CCCH domain-containing protein 67 [Helianthus annuus]KAF5757874.1 putative transcription factor C3H family [Helianthus annuus]KAJ0440444.1 putative transcription factor C3H family [Helianthus annuus]KAJ0639131.1 putative transcription factor C3H family [Helianthus annuus]KAJ0819200.1 putative transcription factor C3H family [Helianthus annuus]